MPKSKGGRPKIEIDWVEFEKLCAIQCTLKEIAEWFGCSDDTIENKCKEHYKQRFSDIYAKKRTVGKISLRRSQFQLAKKNVAMAIWLGKQYLGQREPDVNFGNEKQDWTQTQTIYGMDKNAI